MKPHPEHSSRAIYVLSLVLALVVAGCLSRPALVRHTFALQNPPATVPTAPKGNGMLAIRTVDVSPLFESRSFVYRTGVDSYERDPYAGFLVSPNDTLAIPIRGYLLNSGRFQDVLEAGSLAQPDRVLEVHVSELYGDFRQRDKPAAVLSIRFVLFRTGLATPSSVMLDKSYSRRIPVTENTAAAVVTGWDQALAEIMAEVTAAIGTGS